jgi:TolB-like protein/Tfp pilus assembly protein PilF
MSSDGQDNVKKSEREKFLEEIRRKAEEAELKRLEAEESTVDEDGVPAPSAPSVPPEPVPPVPAAPVPFPVSSSEHSSLPPKAVLDQKILVLRERLSIALDRGRVDKAAELLEELSGLIPDSPDLAMLRERLDAAREDAAQQRERRRPVSSVRPPDSELSRERRSADKKKVIELLEAASNDYQQEKYDKALASLDQLKALDPDDEEAQKLRQQIEKAQRIADLIKREEARTKAERASMKGPEPEPVPVFEKGTDPWGSSTQPQQQQDMGLDLPPEEKGPMGPPKPPVMDRIATRVSKVRIPVKPILVIFVIAVAAVLSYFVIENIRNAVVPPSYSILVFPGTPISGDSSVVWTADGLTDDIIRDLSGVADVRVLGAGTTFAFRGTQRDILKTARALGANYAVQVGVIRTGDRVALQPALYDTVKGKAIWSTQMETTIRDLPATRQEIARRVLQLMEVKPSAEEDATIRRLSTSVPESYDLYLRGRSMMLQRDRHPIESTIQTLQQAVQADSMFADAQSALGWAYVLAYEADHDASPRYLDQARVRVQRASSLAPRNAEAFRVWGVVEFYRAQRARAVERLEEAAGLASSDPETQRRLALARASTGNADGALKAATIAMANDPGDLDSYIVLGQVYQFTDDFAPALTTYEQGLRLALDKSGYSSGAFADVLFFTQQPDRAISVLLDRVAHVRDSYRDYYKLGRVQQSAGKPKAEWTASLERSKALVVERLKSVPNDADALSWKALVHTRLGEFRDAHASIKRALEIGPEDPEVLYNAARMYALQRDKTKAFEQLGRAVNRRYELSRIMDLDFSSLRREEDFVRIVVH